MFIVCSRRKCGGTMEAPTRTTDFAILFLPTESLYAEVLRQPGVFESLQRECKVTLAGPTTLSALLNALQMGFRTLAIEKRSSKVWQILGAAQREFEKYNSVVDRIAKQLNTAANSIDSLGQRTRAMNRTLRMVEALPESVSESALLGFDRDGIPSDLEGASESAADTVATAASSHILIPNEELEGSPLETRPADI